MRHAVGLALGGEDRPDLVEDDIGGEPGGPPRRGSGARSFLRAGVDRGWRCGDLEPPDDLYPGVGRAEAGELRGGGNRWWR